VSAWITIAAGRLCIASVSDGERVRLQGIDAPELADSPRCSPQQRQRLTGSKNPPWCDDAAGARSRDALQAFVLTGRVSIERFGQYRYGRTLANVHVGKRDAGAHLIARGLARLWRDGPLQTCNSRGEAPAGNPAVGLSYEEPRMVALPILHYPTEDDVCRALAEVPAKGWPQDEADLLEVFNRMWERMTAGGVIAGQPPH
jgi:hypothetical protein